MYPILLQIGPVTIYTYGFMIAMGFMIGISLASRQAEKEGIDPAFVSDLGFYCLIAAIVGSRLLFVIVSWRDFSGDLLRILKIWEGGLVFYGGLILATLTMLYLIRKKGMPLLQTLDILAPPVAIGQAIGRLGCLAAGCCYGKETDLPWAITFTNPKCLAPIGKMLHPIQIYAFLDLLLIFGLLVLIRKFKKFQGQIVACYLMFVSIHRFFIEFLRADERGTVEMLSTSQFISVILFILGIALLCYCFSISGKKERNQELLVK